MRTWSAPIRILLVAAAATLAVGCVRLGQEHPEKRLFVIDVSRPEPSTDTADPASAQRLLEVRRFRVSPRFENRGIVYRRGALTYAADFYNEFFIPPHSMLTEETRQWIAASGLFSHTIDASSRMEATHVLEGSVTRLYGDVSNKRKPQSVLEMQFLLVDDRGGEPKIVLQANYQESVALTETSPDAVVEGLAQALALILDRLEEDLRRELVGEPRP